MEALHHDDDRAIDFVVEARQQEHYLKGRPHLDDWISARIELSEINESFDNMKSGKVLRSVIMFGG